MLIIRFQDMIICRKKKYKQVNTERISIFNYEAFYLDYLEGNLGEEDTALLLAFLEEHPDLVEEEDDFVLLDPMMDAPVFEDKDSLKIVSDDAAITLSNAEHFLIAESEGQLPTAKQEELNAFVVQHPQLEKERKYFAAMFLKADESVVYAEKSGLKRKGAVIFWPYIALAAASVLIAFFFVMNNGSEPEMVADKTEKENKELPQKESPVESPENIQYADENGMVSNDSEEVPEQVNLAPNQNAIPQRVVNNTPNEAQMASVDNIKHHKARRVINSVGNGDLQPVATYIDAPALSAPSESDMAKVSTTEMKNPIKPITSRLTRTLNTKVDFQTGKAANNAGGGFFLKIGKFELSRKGGKKDKKK